MGKDGKNTSPCIDVIDVRRVVRWGDVSAVRRRHLEGVIDGIDDDALTHVHDVSRYVTIVGGRGRGLHTLRGGVAKRREHVVEIDRGHLMC